MRQKYEQQLLLVSKELKEPITDLTKLTDYQLMVKLNNLLNKGGCIPFTCDEMEEII